MNWEIIGHDWAVDLLKGHITKNNLRHAYLFTGPEGLGKRTLALNFIRALTCLNPPRAGDYCNECRSCISISRNTYPDLHVVATEANERAIKVDRIRSLRRSLSLSPNEGDRRIALLVDFHNATEQAANALLKTLEEPPSKVILILTARSREAILPTIVSRCEIVSLRSVATEHLEEYLKSKGESTEQAQLLAGVACGRPGWVINLRTDPSVLDRRDRLIGELIELVEGTRQERFSYVKDGHTSLRKSFPVLEDRRRDCIEVLRLWLAYWRDVMLVAFGKLEPRSNPDRENEVKIHSSKIPKEQIIVVIEAIQNTIDAIDRNANLRLVLETLMLELPHYEPEQTR